MNELQKKQLLYLNVLKWLFILSLIAVGAYYAQSKADKWKAVENELIQYNTKR